jgi:cytochrome c
MKGKAFLLNAIYNVAVLLFLIMPQLFTVLYAGNSQQNDMFQAADKKNGKKIAKGCTSCHDLHQGGKKKLAPNLFGIVGRQIAYDRKFSYSNAMLRLRGKIWTINRLYNWIRSPSTHIPGTMMKLGGEMYGQKAIIHPQDRMDLIAYLNSLK